MHQWFHQLITQLLSAKKSCFERKEKTDEINLPAMLKVFEERALIQGASKICAVPSPPDCQAKKKSHTKPEVTATLAVVL